MGRYTDKKKQNNNLKRAYSFLKEKGYQPHIISGILGNLQQESYKHLDSSVENEIGAVGIAQWLGARRKDLENFASEKGKNFKDFDLQLEFLDYELRNTGNSWGSKAREEFFNAKSAEEAAALFVKNFERSGEKPGDKGYENRINNAKAVFLEFNDPNVYAKDSHGEVIVLNPDVVTEEDKIQSKRIKREFYDEQFGVMNERPKVEEPPAVAEVKQEIDTTKKEVEFKNSLASILKNTTPEVNSQPAPERPYQFQSRQLNVPENEFYGSFLPKAEDGGGVVDPPKKENKSGLSDEQVDSILAGADFSLASKDNVEVPKVTNTRNIDLSRAANKRSFRVGDRGNDVKNIQSFLIDNGIMDATSNRGKSNLDGIYGGITRRAVEKFQKDNGLKVDGILGKETLGAIKSKRIVKKDNEVLMNPKVSDLTKVSKETYKPFKQELKKEGILKTKQGEAEGSIKGFQTTISNALGLDTGGVDGKWGEKTSAAFEQLKEYVASNKQSKYKPSLFKSVEAVIGTQGGNMTEENFNDRELDLMRKLAVRDGKINKSFDYNAAREASDLKGSSVDDFMANPTGVLKSLDAVALNLVLGQAGIIKAPDGHVYVYDVYDFNDVGDYETDRRTPEEVYNDRVAYAEQRGELEGVKSVYSKARARASMKQREAQIEAFNKGEKWKPTVTLVDLGSAEELLGH